MGGQKISPILRGISGAQGEKTKSVCSLCAQPQPCEQPKILRTLGELYLPTAIRRFSF